MSLYECKEHSRTTIDPQAPTDTFIKFFDTSRASLARSRFERTGERTSPYLSRPERESYTEYKLFERQDGSRYTYQRDASRWNGMRNNGEWTGPHDVTP